MFLVKMIMRITGYNQTELAEYLNVSRASVNCWVNNKFSITAYQKNILSKKFNIPIEYFDYDLINDKELSKKVYQTIFNNWNIIKYSSQVNNDDELLNEIESELFDTEEIKLSDIEILDCLINQYNPYTGEINEDSILGDNQVHSFLMKIKNKYYKYGVTNISIDDLNDIERVKFENLRIWRKEKTQEEGYYSAYIVFTNKELINIVTAEITKKEDLLNVKGIGRTKYDKYADEIYEILKEV